MKLSDYVIDCIAEAGVRDVFMLPGGGAMHLNDSLGCSDRVNLICNLHEQACAIAAEAYGQFTNNLGVCMVTTGPGSVNALTGVAAGWMDSTPMLIISGQVKRADLCHGKGVRQLGFQEIDIVSMVRSITKYAVTVTDPNRMRFHIEKAIWSAKQGRPGPAWIDVPLDVQAADIDPSKQMGFFPKDDPSLVAPDHKTLANQIKSTLQSLTLSKKPVILVGNGVRLANSEQKIELLARRLEVPILTTWKALDLFDEQDPLFVGRPGAIAQRAANFAQQKSDWFLMIGARMDMGQTAYMHKYLAPNAVRIMVDVDEAEIKKMGTDIAIEIATGADLFIDEMLAQLEHENLDPVQWSQWLEQCRSWKEAYPVMLPEYREDKEGVSLYALVDALSDKVQSGDLVVPGSSGACSEVTMQAFRSKKGVRVLNSEGLGPMGFGISSALGASIASGKHRTVSVDGDGGFAMNTQELETVKRLKLPIKFFVLDNGGYGSIRATQSSYFDGRFFASSPEGGLTLPDLEKISIAYEIPFFEMVSNEKISEALDSCWAVEGPSICRVKVTPRQVTAPRVRSRQTETGSMETAPMQELWPPID